MNAEAVEAESKTNITIPSDDTAAIQPLVDALRQSGAIIESLQPVRQSLEDYFIQAVEESSGGKRVTPGAD